MIQRILIDPGHGGDDNGAVWGYTEEDDINLIIAFLLRYELSKRYFSVELTRERDESVSLSNRVLQSNLFHTDLFVSIHCDAWHNTTANGITTHIYTYAGPKTKCIAQRIHNAIISQFPKHRNRGVKQSDFYVLRKTRMPAVLIECEFLSNPEARKFLKEPENQLGLALAIANGVSEDNNN